MTSAEEFPEEPPVPPAILDDAMYPVGTILTLDRLEMTEVRIPITVRDENVDEVLEVQASLSVDDPQPYDAVCQDKKIDPTTGLPEREQYDLVIEAQRFRPGLCTRIDVFVSPQFAGGPCRAVPVDPIDSAHAIYWIWEMTGQTGGGPDAETLLTSCQTTTPGQGAPTTSMMVP